MRHMTFQALLFAAFALICSNAAAITSSRFQLDVLVEGETRTEYKAGSAIYIEAVRGREYALRLTNPTPHRVAVALSVDGLNTIDARHTDPWNAAKWVLGPYESTVISGWQVDSGFARRFFFTSEESSYGAKLGQTENLGLIEAVVYRERRPRTTLVTPEHRRNEALSDAAPKPSGASERQSKQAPSEADAIEPESGRMIEEYAATGMGERTRHAVRSVRIDLESHPIATTRIRYEFRPQLVELGILSVRPSPLERRERARGFERFCPE